MPCAEAIDFSEINRSAKPEGQNPVSELKQLVRGNGEKVALGVEGVDSFATLLGRAGRSRAADTRADWVTTALVH